MKRKIILPLIMLSLGVFSLGSCGGNKTSNQNSSINSSEENTSSESVVTHNYGTSWEKDETHHWHICTDEGCNEIKDKAEHSGGEATTTEKAVCEVCNEPYGALKEEIHTHDFSSEVEEEKYLATLGKCGEKSSYYKSCSCGEKGEETFEGSKEVEHDFSSTEYQSDKSQHWVICSAEGCEELSPKENHKGGEATATEKAICEVCNVSYGMYAGHVHDMVVSEVVEEASCEKGDIVNRVCSDEECGHTEFNVEVGLPKGHTDKVCYDETKHWNGCEKCDVKAKETNHTFGRHYELKEETLTLVTSCIYCDYSCTEEITSTDPIEVRIENNLLAVLQSGRSVILGDDIKVNSSEITLENELNVTIDLNGKTLEASLSIDETSKLSIINSGFIKGFDPSLYIDEKVYHVLVEDGLYSISEHNYQSEITYPDCQNGGYTTHTCEGCGDIYISDEVPAGDHNFTLEVVDQEYLVSEATCSKTATYYKLCSGCNIPSTSEEDTFEDGTTLEHLDNGNWVKSADGKGHYKVCGNENCNEELDYAEHSGGTANMTTLAVCSTCNASYGLYQKTISYLNTNNWNEVYIYTWRTGATDDYPTEKWPGTKMTKGTNFHSYTVTSSTPLTNLNVIFNDGTNDDSKKTNDLTISETEWCFYGNYYKGFNEKNDNITIKIYFTKPNSGWGDTIKAHMWKENGEGTTWPGEATHWEGTNSYGEHVYSIDFKIGHYTCIIFNDEKGNQTADGVVPMDGKNGCYISGNKLEWYKR